MDRGGLWDDDFAPDHVETTNRADSALRDGLPGYRHEFRITSDGSTHWLSEEVGIQKLSDAEWSLVGVVVDSTKRHEAETAHRASEAQLQQILTRADCLLWQARVVENPAGRLDWNLITPQSILSEKLLSHQPGGGRNLIWTEQDVPEYAEMSDRSTKAVRSGAAGYEQEFRVSRGGRLFWLRENVSITSNGPGRWNLVGVITDISDRRAMQAALAAEKERLSVTLQAMAEGVITVDSHGLVQFMNPVAATLLELEAAQLVGQPLEARLVLQDTRTQETVESPVGRVLRDGTVVDLLPHTAVKSSGNQPHLVEGCCAPVHDAAGAVVGAVLVLRDVTDRLRLEEELERASRLESVGILAGGIAHDFNNILTAIVGNLGLAELDLHTMPGAAACVQDAKSAAMRARDLTQQLLTFAKGGDPVRGTVNLTEIVTDVVNFCLHGSSVKCDFDLAEGLWPVDADKGQLAQVVQNLVINAIQAMPAGGNLRIVGRNQTIAPASHATLSAGAYVRLAVVDTGVGIKPEDLARIFDPYFTTKARGTGLGLATVYSIVRKHQGHIEVESDVGRGTTFQFWVPAARGVVVKPAAPAVKPSVPLQGRLLFMDDEEPIRRMAATILGRLGFAVETASDGVETVKRFAGALGAGRPFDLVVMDLTVPGGMGGAETLAELRKLDPMVKAIVSSGYSSNPVLANYREHGFCGMVAKPYEVNDLLRVLHDVLREKGIGR